MRGKPAKKRKIAVDNKFSNLLVAKFINRIMKNGKKSVAQTIVYTAFDIMQTEKNSEPLETFETALRNVMPQMEVRSRRIGGANYQVPIPVDGARQESLAIKWLIDAARSKKGLPMHKKLAQELLDAANNTGGAVKKKEDVHKMAEANKAFSHFR